MFRHPKRSAKPLNHSRESDGHTSPPASASAPATMLPSRYSVRLALIVVFAVFHFTLNALQDLPRSLSSTVPSSLRHILVKTDYQWPAVRGSEAKREQNETELEQNPVEQQLDQEEHNPEEHNQEEPQKPADVQQQQLVEDKKKLRFILHVGPLKTGTTTIQNDLTMLAFEGLLGDDGWHYATNPTNFKDGTTIDAGLKDLSADDDQFFVDIKKSMDLLIPFGNNVIHSKEGLSVNFAEFEGVYKKLRDALSDDWDVEIVSGYRPYYDWIVSLWSQGQKRNIFDYADTSTWPWFREDGEFVFVQRLFPNVYGFWMHKLKWFSNSIVEQASPYLPVRLYDMNDPRGPTAALICDVLGENDAPSSCARALEDAMKKEGTTHENKGSVDIIHYDAVGLEAAKRGLVDHKKHTRYDIMTAIAKHMKEDLGQSAAKDWPMDCPDQDIYDEIFEKTVRYESKCMPQIWDTNPDREQELRDDFQSKVDKNGFCHVSLDKLFENNKELITFLERFSPPGDATKE